MLKKTFSKRKAKFTVKPDINLKETFTWSLRPWPHVYAFDRKRRFSFSGLAHRPHVSGENGHRKHIFSKMHSRMKIFKNAGVSLWTGEKNIQIRYTRTRIFSQTEEKKSPFSKKFGYVWTRPKCETRTRCPLPLHVAPLNQVPFQQFQRPVSWFPPALAAMYWSPCWVFLAAGYICWTVYHFGTVWI